MSKMSRFLKSLSNIAPLVMTLIFLLIVIRFPCCRLPWIKACDDDANAASLPPLDRFTPFILIDGIPGSGAGLLRQILDAHSLIVCSGSEDNVLPATLTSSITSWTYRSVERQRLAEAGVKVTVLQSAFAAMFLELLPPVPHSSASVATASFLNSARVRFVRRCLQTPLVLLSDREGMVESGFPNARFVLFVRDGRAVAAEMLRRGTSLVFARNTSSCRDYMSCLLGWNSRVNESLSHCQRLGKSRCLLVHYEHLVIRPKDCLETLLRFLELNLNEEVLRSAVDILHKKSPHDAIG